MPSTLQMPGYVVAKYQSVKMEEALWADITQLAAFHRRKVTTYLSSLLRPVVRQEMLKMHAEQGRRLAAETDEDDTAPRSRKRD